MNKFFCAKSRIPIRIHLLTISLDWISNQKPYLSLELVLKLVVKEKPNSIGPFRTVPINYRELSSHTVIVL